MQFFSIIAAVFAVANVANALTSSLQQVTGFNAGPTKAGMFVSQLHNFWFLLACLHHELSVLILKKNVLNEFYSPQKQFSAKKKKNNILNKQLLILALRFTSRRRLKSPQQL